MPGATLLLNQTALVNGGEGVALRVLTAPPPPAGVRRPLAAEPGDVSRVWLEGVSWDTAAPAALKVDARGGGDVLLFSDSGDEVLDAATGDAAAAQPLPEDELAAGFVSEASPWFQGAKQEALDATGIPYFLASGAQERPAVPAVQAEPGRVRVGHTPPSSAIVLVPCIVAAVLFAAVVLALAVQYARARSCRRRSLPSTMGKSMSGTDRSVHSGAAVGHSRKGSGDGGRGVSAHVSAAGSDDGEIAAGQGRGAAPAATPRPRTAYSLVSVPEPHSLRAGGGEDLEAARSAPLAPPDVTEGSLNQALHECASSPGNSGRGSLSFSYSQFPDSPTSAVSHLSHTSWPAGPRTLWDASQPLSHSLRLFTPAHLVGAASPAPIGRAAAAGDTPTGGAQAAVAVAPQPTAGVAAVAAVPGAGAAPADHTAAQEGPAAAAGGAYGAAPRSGGSTAVREDISTFSIGLPGPPSRHAPDERDQALTATLDAMHSAGDALGDLFEVMSAEDRRYGRHGVVQPVRRAADGAAMAAKFYRERSVFEAELRARSMLPRSVLLATKLVDHSTIGSGSDSDSDNSGSVAGWSPPAGGGGAGLPPHIVMDRGTPLADWVAARGPAAGFVERVRIVEEVAERLATMHAAGWTHGALKPGNVLWREIGGEWLLTDVCDAALIGKRGAVSCVPPLSPPEAATAVREQQEVPAAAATDLWALGVIACQLLAPATAVHAAMQPDSAAAWDAACGRAPFPWEPAAPERPACVAELRGAAAAVLGCVSREPGDRPTAARLAAALRDVLTEHEQPAPSV